MTLGLRNLLTAPLRRHVVRHRNLLLFLALSVLWGSAFVAIKAGLAYFPPVLFAALRYDIAGVVMLAYATYVSDRVLPRGREWVAVVSGGALMIAAYHAFLFVGETDPAVTSASAAIVVSLSPILTTGFARAILPCERLTPVGLVGLVLGLVGVGLLTEPRPSTLLQVPPGLILVCLAAASFALGSVLDRRLGYALAIEPFEAWAMLVGALLMHGVSLAIGESVATVEVTMEALLSLGYLSLAASALGFLIYFDLLNRLGPIEINLVSYVAPAVAALVGFLLLGEVVDTFAVAGFLVILAGFGLLKRDAIRAEIAGGVARGRGD